MRARLPAALLLSFTLAFAFAGQSCDSTPGPQPCDYPEDCEDIETLPVGVVWTCPDEFCEAIPCEGSSDCIIETYCERAEPTEEDPAPQGWCTEGCHRDNDCYAGYFCRNGVCEEEPCRNSQFAALGRKQTKSLLQQRVELPICTAPGAAAEGFRAVFLLLFYLK